MKKLISGIVEFKKNIQPSYRETFAELALGQKPDALFIVCSDSRVAVNVFASTNPGDLFVVRNVGNLIPPCGCNGHSVSDESEIAALEFALLNLKVRNIIICGHSECGAMNALYNGREKLSMPHLKSWLVHAQPALDELKAKEIHTPNLTPQNELSQLNVLLQIEHLKSYSIVKERMDAGELRIHGWWFDIANADVHGYDEEVKKFVSIDEVQADKILSRLV